MDDVVIDFMEMEWVGVDWICLSVHMIHCHAVMRTVMTFQVPLMGNYLTC